MEKRLEEANKDRDNLKDQVTALEKELADERNAVADLQSQLDATQTAQSEATSAVPNRDLEEKIADLETQLQEALKERGKAKRLLEPYKKVLQSTQEKLESAEAALAEAKAPPKGDGDDNGNGGGVPVPDNAALLEEIEGLNERVRAAEARAEAAEERAEAAEARLGVAPQPASDAGHSIIMAEGYDPEYDVFLPHLYKDEYSQDVLCRIGEKLVSNHCTRQKRFNLLKNKV